MGAGAVTGCGCSVGVWLEPQHQNHVSESWHGALCKRCPSELVQSQGSWHGKWKAAWIWAWLCSAQHAQLCVTTLTRMSGLHWLDLSSPPETSFLELNSVWGVCVCMFYSPG